MHGVSESISPVVDAPKFGQKRDKNLWLHTSHQLYKMFASVLLVQSPSRYPTKKPKPIKTVVGPNSPRSFGGKKNKSPCLFGPKCQKSPRFLPGGRHQGRVQGMSHAPNRLVSGRTCLGTSTKPLEFGSEILDKTQVTTSEHRLKMRNKWKNMEKWGGDSSFQITGL